MSEGFERPDHSDFWLLSEIVREYEERVLRAPEGEQERRGRAIVRAQVDEASLAYWSAQRAVRLLDHLQGLPGDMTKDDATKMLIVLSALYFEGALIGMVFRERKDSMDRPREQEMDDDTNARCDWCKRVPLLSGVGWPIKDGARVWCSKDCQDHRVAQERS